MDRLRATAEAAGYFSRRDALEEGHDDRSIRRLLRARLWLRVRPGAYTFPDLWPSEPDARHRVIGHAVAEKLGARVALSHTTSALEHGLRVWGADLSLVHMTRLDGGPGRTEAGVAHHEGLTLSDDLMVIDGRLVMNPARAAIETASLLSTEAGLVVLDSLLHLGKATRDELDASYASMCHWPGLQRTQVAVRMADRGAQSVGESRTRYLCYTRDIPAPELQYDVFDHTGRLIGTTDFAWPEQRLLGEFDGKVKYERFLRTGESPGDAVFREKRREDRICEELGWRMVRLVWADLSNAAETAGRIRRMLRAAA